MANYTAMGRTNYVKVTDIEALKKAIEPYPMKVEEGTGVTEGRYAFFCEDMDGGGWSWYDPENDEDRDWDIVCPFLVPGEVLIVQEVGNEKLRYLIGWAQAWTCEGFLCSVSLDDLRQKAGDLLAERGVTEYTMTDPSY